MYVCIYFLLPPLSLSLRKKKEGTDSREWRVESPELQIHQQASNGCDRCQFKPGELLREYENRGREESFGVQTFPTEHPVLAQVILPSLPLSTGGVYI